MLSRRTFLLTAAVALTLPVGSANATAGATVELDSLLNQFATSPGFEAHFQESKFLAMLKAPLKSEGTIHFARPGELAKRTEKPQKSVVLVQNHKLVVADARGQKTIDLQSHPALVPLVESFLHLLSGDRSRLEANFRLSLSKSGESYTLRLEPKNKELQSLLSSIEVQGSGLLLSSMTVTEKNGDRTVTEFSGVNAKRTYGEAEKKKIFSPAL